MLHSIPLRHSPAARGGLASDCPASMALASAVGRDVRGCGGAPAGRLAPRLLAGAALMWLAGCSSLGPSAPAAPRDPNLAAFSSQLIGMNEAPPVPGNATGRIDAVLNKDTRMLRWRLSYTSLSGPATMAHFHGPAAVGVNAPVVLPFPSPVKSPMDGQATLTPAQAADLMAGRWYANVHTAAHPAGEIRGQMILRE